MNEELWPDVGVYGESADMLRASRGVLERFDRQIGAAVESVVEAFQLPQHGIGRDDVRQEAEVLVMLYAGLTKERRWGYGELANWVRGNESETQALLTNHLRMNLSQIIGRKLASLIDASSLDLMIQEGNEPPDEDMEQRTVNRLDREHEADILRKHYPVFAMGVLDNKTQLEIADGLGLTRRQVRYAIDKQKHAYLADFVTRYGLKLDGDETLEELSEAFEHLNRSAER